jgi:hypothetical protein
MLPEAAKFIDDWQAAQKARLESGVEQDSYVYLHLNADDDQPHHVGVGHTVGRPWGMKRRNTKHKNKVAKHGVRVEIISEDLTDAQAKWWEVRWIKALRNSGYDLTNLTDGGDGTRGYTHPEDDVMRRALEHSEFMRKLFSSEEGDVVRLKIRKTLTELMATDKGKIIRDKNRSKKLKFYDSPAGQVWKEDASIRQTNYLKSDEGLEFLTRKKKRNEEFFNSEEGNHWCQEQSDRLIAYYSTEEGKETKRKAQEKRNVLLNNPEWKVSHIEKIKESLSKPSSRWKLLLRDWHRSNVRPYSYWGA